MMATLRIKPTPQAYMSSSLLFCVRERETVRHVVLLSLIQNKRSKPEPFLVIEVYVFGTVKITTVCSVFGS